MKFSALKRYFKSVCEYSCGLFLISSKDEVDKRRATSKGRILLVGSDVGLTLLVMIVIAILANVFISADDNDANAKSNHEHVSKQLTDNSIVREAAIKEVSATVDELYRCPLHAEVESVMPGFCPIGGEPLVRADMAGEAMRQQHSENSGYSQYVAHVGRDVRRVTDVVLLSAGWAQKVFAVSDGGHIKQGDLLLETFSPKLADLQRAYLEALARNDMVELTVMHDQLQMMGQSTQQIRALKFQREADGLSYLYAPVDGIISTVNVSEGQFVPRDTEVFQLLDLSSVWMVFELNAGDEVIVAGQRVEAFEKGGNGQVFKGEVDEVVSLSGQANTRLVRLRFNADAAVLRNSEFADVRVYRQRSQLSTLPGVIE